MLLLNFLMLNMFVMVICDAYEALKNRHLLHIEVGQ